MLLKKLTLYNFRPFKGKHELEFSTDKDKNVTLVMAENGAGKTTLAQAFQWALYGRTEGFENKSMLNSLVEKEMLAGTSETVKVELELVHNDIEYIISRTQNYRKDVNNEMKQDGSILDIINKQSDGQTNFNNPLKNISLVSSILPEPLSRYFFFDGERIGKMATEVSKGKSDEFKIAVQNLLGLTALKKATDHLKPTSADSVIGRYNSQIDEYGDQQTRELRDKIYKSTEQIEKNNERIEKVEEEIEYYTSEIDKFKAELLTYADAEKAQQRLNQLHNDLEREKAHKNNTIATLMSNFSKDTCNYFSRSLINEALIELKNTDNIDKGIPDIKDKTIKYLIDRKKCLCGADLSDSTCEAVQNLVDLLQYIPPKSLGTSINQFVEKSNASIKRSSNYYENVKSQLSTIRGCSATIERKEEEIGEIDKSILKMSNSKIKDLKERQIDFERTLSIRNRELTELSANNIYLEKVKAESEAEISRMQLKINKNKSIEIQRQYAIAAYDKIKTTYDYRENLTRDSLEKEINNLFKQIYDGGMTINIDDKYKITTYVNELDNNSKSLDSNTAKSYSIIFAFIVGVINLAKNKANDKQSNEESDTIITDEYPLVMDAPLSSFDQRRIKNICEVIPNIARQVIVFIKDTDGNIAKRELKDKIGMEYEVSLKNRDIQLDSIITKVGEF